MNDEQLAENIGNRFRYHPPKGDQLDRYQHVRNHGRMFAEVLNNTCPRSPELIRAIDKIDEAVMLANASIARYE